MVALSTSRAGRIRLPPTAGSVQRHDGWTQSEDRLLLACVARHCSHSVAWTKVFAEFSKANHRERSKPALETRWHTLRRHAGAGSSSKTKGAPRRRSSGKQVSAQLHAVGHLQEYEAYNEDSLITFASHHQYRAEERAPRIHPSASLSPLFTTGQHLHAAPIDSNFAVGISYEQNGVRIDGCVPGLELMVFSATCVQISGPGHTTAKSEQPAFHLKVVDGGGVVGVRLPQGTMQSIKLVPRQEEGGFAVGAAEGLARGMAVQTSYVSAEGFAVVMIS